MEFSADESNVGWRPSASACAANAALQASKPRQ